MMPMVFLAAAGAIYWLYKNRLETGGYPFGCDSELQEKIAEIYKKNNEMVPVPPCGHVYCQLLINAKRKDIP